MLINCCQIDFNSAFNKPGKAQKVEQQEHAMDVKAPE